MKTIPIQKTITTEEAAKLLGCTPSNISWMGRRGHILKISMGIYDRTSVLSRAGLKNHHDNKIHSGITKVVIQHFENYAEPPTYRYVQFEMKISSVSTLRYYILRMEKLGLIDIYKGHIYLPGLRDKIKELVRTEYPK
jgi:hypothetical protein